MRSPRAGRRPNATPDIGEILLRRGVITFGQLEEARLVRQSDRRELEETLLSLGYVRETDLARASAERLGLEYAEPREGDVDPEALNLVDGRVLRRHGVVPLRVEGGRLIVATSDPTNFYAIEDLMMLSGLPVTPVVATADRIGRLLNAVFAAGHDVSKLLAEAAGSADHDDRSLEPEREVGFEEAPVVRLVNSILRRAVREGASDVHLEPRGAELAVRTRVDGWLRDVTSVPPKLQSAILARLKVLASLDIAERRLPQDGRFTISADDRRVDVRIATLPTAFGEKAVLRLLDTASVDVELAGLGFEPAVLRRYEEVFCRPYGTILVTGPTGSGKSTTLYATLRELNSPEKNIVTIEDPIEYRLPGISQIQVNPKIGLTFARGLRSVLRSDPDVVMIGEIRDPETAKISVEAALTGHLVLATLHTNDAPSAVTRLTEMGVEPYLTSSAVDCVIAQRLARRLCERCKRPAEMGSEALEALGFPLERLPEQERAFFEAVGCEWCSGTGYRGRIGIYEMMVLADEIRELVLKRASVDEVSRAAEGMVRLREDGLIKAARGITSVEEVLRTVV
ncbi:MAG TPA: ATPase, T2SS/T4P/T4SS family [Rubrobacteraceae bacterium]|nr:ATPase, T2SS/T4P/T4SS family [Rubrobacteraceae bacterium]